MLYAIIARDIPASQGRRLANRPAHPARLKQLKEEGRPVLAGPYPAIDNNDLGAVDFTGNLIAAEFDFLAATRSWAEVGPYRTAGVYAEMVVKLSKRALP